MVLGNSKVVAYHPAIRVKDEGEHLVVTGALEDWCSDGEVLQALHSKVSAIKFPQKITQPMRNSMKTVGGLLRVALALGGRVETPLGLIKVQRDDSEVELHGPVLSGDSLIPI